MKNEEKQWHPNFLKYMEFIINHKNYKGLPIIKRVDGTYSWIEMAKTEIGKKRIEWAKKKAIELGIPLESEGLFAKVMFAIHPTKKKICQVCGKEMSLFYIYPSKNLIKAIYKKFGYEYPQVIALDKIVEDLLNKGIKENELKTFLLTKVKNTSKLSLSSTFKEIICHLEIESRVEGKKTLSPGAMSNFPDRFDGFHTYNLCCRKKEDKGRSDENMITYSKDRRAYQYLNDGNLRAADKFMTSNFFKGVSADHIGPISLGFVHDSRYLRPLSTSENSAKRDRLTTKDIETIISIHERTKIYPMSWYSKYIWEFIKENFKNSALTMEDFSNSLKQNLIDFMYVLKKIKDLGEVGENFIYKILIEPKIKYFKYNYEFDESGNIVNQTKRNITKAADGEIERFIRISFESIDDFDEKENRNKKPNLTKEVEELLKSLCDYIIKNGNPIEYFSLFKEIIILNQVKNIKLLKDKISSLQ